MLNSCIKEGLIWVRNPECKQNGRELFLLYYVIYFKKKSFSDFQKVN